MITFWRLLLLIGVMLSGCAVGPDFKKPALELPKHWSVPSQADASSALQTWWQRFNDPVLNQLLQDARQNNLELKQALARIQDVRAQRSATFAAGLPSVSGKSALSRRYNNTSSAGQASGSSAGGGFGVGNQLLNIFQLGFDAQWELDFFGGVRRAIEAADATVASEVEQQRDILVTLLGEVARLYIDLRSNQQQLKFAEQALALQTSIKDLQQVRQQAGLNNALEATLAEARLEDLSADIPQYQDAIQTAIHALSVLTGREPNALQARLSPMQDIPRAQVAVLPDLPSDLLQRRPDIRRAEQNIAIANAYVGIATAELYPKVNLAAFIGLQNLSITGFTPVGKSWSSAASLSMPVFNWGKLSANIKSKEAQYQQSRLAYESTVLNAFKEVEDALLSLLQEQQSESKLQAAVNQQHLAVKLATELYQQGLSNYVNVVQQQQQLLAAEVKLLTSSAKVSRNLVALYKALGGGWQDSSVP